MKRPSFQFYPSDWLRDTALRTCSVAARGLWIDMICYMHEGSPYGYLKVNNKVILPQNLARMVGLTLDEVQGYLHELNDAGVYEIDSGGSIYSKRMIRDEVLRNKRAEGGKLGGNPNLKVKHKVNLKVKQIITPSSSSSSSSSNIKPMPVGFDLFWDAYDKKVGKPNSLKAWLKITFKDDLLQKIVEKAKADKKAKPDNKFRKDPERWLKGQHWLDEVVIEQASEEKLLPLGTDAQIEQAYRIECGGDPSRARFNSYQEMRKFVQEFRDKRIRNGH